MTEIRTTELKKALKAHLEVELAGQGFPAEDPSEPNADVPVVTDVIEDDEPLYVRIDGFGMLHGGGSNGRSDRYSFMAHVFCNNTPSDSDVRIDGEAETERVQSLLVSALLDWVPFDGAGSITHITSNVAEDEDPATHHGVSKFKIMINGG